MVVSNRDHKTVHFIRNAYRYDESLGYVVHGPRGSGKTVYTCIIGSQLIGTTAEPDWEGLKKWLIFTPKEFTQMVLKVNHTQIWLDWDDAGYWINRLFWYDEFVKESLRYMTLQRTQFSCIMFSTPSLTLIPNKVLDLEDVYRVRVVKVQKNESYANNATLRRPRKAILTKPWHSDYNSRGDCTHEYDEYFNGLFPDAFYEWYQPLRKQYTQLAAANIQAALERSQGETMRMGLERIKEELEGSGLLPSESQVSEVAEVVDSFAGPVEQVAIDKARVAEKKVKRHYAKQYHDDPDTYGKSVMVV